MLIEALNHNYDIMTNLFETYFYFKENIITD
jgi:hypothetical protein